MQHKDPLEALSMYECAFSFNNQYQQFSQTFSFLTLSSICYSSSFPFYYKGKINHPSPRSVRPPSTG